MSIEKAKSSTNQALAAKKATLKGTFSVKTKKVRTSTTFRLPKTLSLARSPKYPRKSIPHAPRLDQYSIIKHPWTSEDAIRKIEQHQTLVFIVDVKANKRQIKEAVKLMYGIESQRINTLIR